MLSVQHESGEDAVEWKLDQGESEPAERQCSRNRVEQVLVDVYQQARPTVPAQSVQRLVHHLQHDAVNEAFPEQG